MTDLKIIVELRYDKKLADYTSRTAEKGERSLDTKRVPLVEGITYDKDFPPVFLPGTKSAPQSRNPRDISDSLQLDENPENGTYIVRGSVPNLKALETLEKTLGQNSEIVGIFSDVQIQSTIICPGSPAMGTDAGVERLLCTEKLHQCGLDGLGVLVAVVDTGINLEYLQSRGKNPGFDQFRSWVPQAGLIPGQLPVDHGTMVAYDVTIAAPKCTLLDIALLLTRRQGSTIMEGYLSDAVVAYSHLINIIAGPRRPGELNALVVNNSWGMFHPSWDFPVGHPGNYSDNPNHPFNRIVGTLERAGADILFAAGNCGADCPDGRCQRETNMSIYGANSHPQVLTVAGVDVSKERVGYSSIGPGRLSRMKPDISGYTHFRGSGVYAADGGTSAATPVVAGVVAALRSQIPNNPADPSTSPAAIRALLTKTAEDRGMVGYDFEYGWGIVNGCKIAELFCGEKEEPEEPKCRKVVYKVVKCKKEAEPKCNCRPVECCEEEIEVECGCGCQEEERKEKATKKSYQDVA